MSHEHYWMMLRVERPAIVAHGTVIAVDGERA